MINPRKGPNHAKRIDWMCNRFGIATPNWAEPQLGSNTTILAGIRNDTFHEALFMDAPLGFATTAGGVTENLLLEMNGLISRILLALIGAEDAEYVQSPVNLGNIVLLKLG